jgi:hypothetical protein
MECIGPQAPRCDLGIESLFESDVDQGSGDDGSGVGRAAYAALLAERNRHDDGHRALTMARAAIEVSAAGGYRYVEADARAVLERLR